MDSHRRNTLAVKPEPRPADKGVEGSSSFHEVEPDLLTEVAGSLVLGLEAIEQEKERLKTEGRLRQVCSAPEESERLASATLDSLSARIAILDKAGVVLAVNQAWRRFAAESHSVSGAVCEGANYLAVCDAVTGAEATMARAFAEGIRSVLDGRQRDFSLEYPCQAPSQQRWFVGRVTRFVGEGPVRVVVAHENVTECKRVELRLTAFSALGERLSGARTAREAAIVIAEVADQLLGWDACVCDLYSAAEDKLSQVLGMDIINGRRADCDPVNDHLPPSPLARRVIEHGGQLVLRDSPAARSTDTLPYGDTTRPAAAILYVPIRQGAEVIGLISIQSYSPGAYDQRSLETLQALADHCGGTLARLRIEESLRISEAQFRSVWEKSIDGMRLTDREGRIVAVNEAYCQLVKLPREKLEGELYSVVYEGERPSGDLESYQERLEAGTVAPRITARTRLWNSEEVDLEVANSFIELDRQGKVLFSIFRDTTERRQIEADLRQSQKLEGIGQLAGGVAHDFNNMLAVMRGNAELMLMDGDVSTPAREFLDQIISAAESAANLARQLLLFCRKQVMQSRAVVLNDLIVNLGKMLRRVIREDIKLECAYGDPTPFVQADPGMLEQVVLNLVVNACDAMPQGGLLQISTQAVRLKAEDIRTRHEAREGDFLCLAVRDTGTGIPPEVLPRIFEPFFTTKDVGKGTGLGLPTVHGIVKQHMGWVEVFSQVGTGTVFKIFLPAIPEPTIVLSESLPEVGLPGGTETILLVEDESLVRLIVRRVLESHGYKVHAAASAREAQEIWRNHSGEVALLLTDMVMPEGVTGRELSELLRAQKPELKVVLMSGYSRDVVGSDTEFVRQTESYFLHKPCSTDDVVRTVRNCLDGK